MHCDGSVMHRIFCNNDSAQSNIVKRNYQKKCVFEFRVQYLKLFSVSVCESAFVASTITIIMILWFIIINPLYSAVSLNQMYSKSKEGHLFDIEKMRKIFELFVCLASAHVYRSLGKGEYNGEEVTNDTDSFQFFLRFGKNPRREKHIHRFLEIRRNNIDDASCSVFRFFVRNRLRWWIEIQ